MKKPLDSRKDDTIKDKIRILGLKAKEMTS